MGVDECLAHVASLRRYARVLTGDAHRADDLVQDTLERACQRFHLWQPGTRLGAWLMTLMHNLHANQRRDWRHDDQALDIADLPEGAHEPMASMPDRMDLERAWARLTPAAREILMLVSVQEHSYAEVAGILAIPVGTVMSRLHRAREQLRLLMTDDGAGLPARRTLREVGR